MCGKLLAVHTFQHHCYNSCTVSTLLLTYFTKHTKTRSTWYAFINHNVIIKLNYILSARSPLYSHISATIQGLSSIRAFHEEKRFLNKFHYYQNEHTKAWFMKIAVSRWFGMRIDLIGSSFLTIIAFTSIPLADGK